MKYGLLGERLGHSISPRLHNLIGCDDYVLCEKQATELDDFFAQRDFCGINVTVPYKQRAMHCLDRIDPIADGIGAVNTVVNRGGFLLGLNTDVDGLRALLEHGEVDVRSARVLILGTGATSRTAQYVCSSLGAKCVDFVSRTPSASACSYADAPRVHPHTNIIINTTPCGMYPDCDASPLLDIDEFRELTAVIDVVYNPLRTSLVSRARARGINAHGGLYMLCAQAIEAAKLFGYGSMTAEALYSVVSREQENIVLIGMPSAGKSTVGALIAKQTGRRLIDTDNLIVQQQGCAVADIFANSGETYFRKLETEAVQAAALERGAVIATGGGVPEKEENVCRLRQNGRIYYLYRDPTELVPTASRPTASTEQDMMTLFMRRENIYEAACDVKIVQPTAESAAQSIMKEFCS